MPHFEECMQYQDESVNSLTNWYRLSSFVPIEMFLGHFYHCFSALFCWHLELIFLGGFCQLCFGSPMIVSLANILCFTSTPHFLPSAAKDGGGDWRRRRRTRTSSGPQPHHKVALPFPVASRRRPRFRGNAEATREPSPNSGAPPLLSRLLPRHTCSTLHLILWWFWYRPHGSESHWTIGNETCGNRNNCIFCTLRCPFWRSSVTLIALLCHLHVFFYIFLFSWS
jgi:hypothetical protein